MGAPEGPQTGSKTAKNGLFRPKADLVVPNWWNSVEQGWSNKGHTQGDVMEPFHRSGMAIRGCQRPQIGPRRTQNVHFEAISGFGGSELVE